MFPTRSDETCPGEMSKTFRLVQIAEATLLAAGNAATALAAQVGMMRERRSEPDEGLRDPRPK